MEASEYGMAAVLSATRRGAESPNPKSGDSEIVTLPSGAARLEWRRNARARRVSLRINPSDGAIVVTLPLRASRRAGMALLMGHVDWVARRIAALPAAVTLADGAEVPIGGVPHLIRHHPDPKSSHRRGGAWLEDGELHVTGRLEFLPRRAIDFLRAEAGRRLSALVRAKAGQAGVTATRITIKDTTSRWGSCAPDGALAFSWRLVMAPEFVQDYVTAHEVAHLRHMNHGPAFWHLVSSLTAHMPRAMAWLNHEGPRLLRVG
jgi:predicted metal-dependent hydrolase